MNRLSVGSIVKCRGREWVLLPSPVPHVAMLRPLTGSEREVTGIFLGLSNLGLDRIEPAEFPLPGPEDTSDALGAELLWNSARLALRDGAGPFRSLGRISFRPRAYQFVPLLMALRLDPVRLLIADDVGIGKTIEALLIARELLDRGDIRRLCVLCPPYLCDQWCRELWEKFQIEAAVVSSGTIGSLERDIPQSRRQEGVFGYYPFLVVSIDYAKSERHKPNFLQHCPDFIIVDEVHGAARPASRSLAQQQRHDLLRSLAAASDKHLVLLSATPHSGIEESFLSLLGLLRPPFEHLNLHALTEPQRDDLARHFIQRRRADVERWLGEDTPFPKREPQEETYKLAPAYHALFKRVYDFSRELVRSGETMTGWKQRIRFWSALSLLRCVMSSPAAAQAALTERLKGQTSLTEDERSDESYTPYLYENPDQDVSDVQPSHIIEECETDLPASARRRLKQFAEAAEKLSGTDEDQKTVRCAELVGQLLKQGYNPIVWCRYIATSTYVAQELQRRLHAAFPEAQIMAVNGGLSEEERRGRVEELAGFEQRVLVATDCLSEGINLQDWFNAVIHYDLPWNPNRLEQREGRVDRFGQISKKVKAVLFYGEDNPVDGAVLDVLLRKAKQIHRDLGVHVPVPQDSETVLEAVLKSLFYRRDSDQLLLFAEDATTKTLHREWDEHAAREQESRTRFAQRAIKPEEVERELKETDSVLGEPGVVQRFVLNACQRLGLVIREDRKGGWILGNLSQLPELVRSQVPTGKTEWRVTFLSPAPDTVTYLGRNHPFVASLARYLLEAALTRHAEAPAARCGVARTRAVDRRTCLLLLRLRYLLQEPDRSTLLAEEVHVCGFRGPSPEKLEWLPEADVLALLGNTEPGANVPPGERTQILSELLGWWPALQAPLRPIIETRAAKLRDAHRRVRQAAQLARRGLDVKPQDKPDLLGLLVLLPVPKTMAGDAPPSLQGQT